MPHEGDLRRGRAGGLIDEVAEVALQGQGLGSEVAGGFDGVIGEKGVEACSRWDVPRATSSGIRRLAPLYPQNPRQQL